MAAEPGWTETSDYMGYLEKEGKNSNDTMGLLYYKIIKFLSSLYTEKQFMDQDLYLCPQYFSVWYVCVCMCVYVYVCMYGTEFTAKSMGQD